MKKNLTGTLKSFGIKFHAVTYATLKQEISRCIATREPVTIGYMNLHGAYLYRNDIHFREFFDAENIVYADGFSITFLRKLLWGDVAADMRFTLTHELPDFLTFCRDNGYSVFYVGSEEAVVRAGIDYFARSIPGLKFGGCGGFFDQTAGSATSRSVLREIETFGPDILLVGMGMPRQEIWIHGNRNDIAAPIVYACGAAIEFYSGFVARPPAWLGSIGLVWLYRLIQEPRKLWFRYLVEPFFLLPVVFKELAERIRGSR